MAGSEKKEGHGWGFYVEMTLVALGVLAVVAWLGALGYVIFKSL